MGGSDSIMEMFIYENTQLTERLEEVLIEGEKEGGLNIDHINEIFRIMHTLKGSAAMMEFSNISTLAHHCEDMFFIIREESALNPDWGLICDIVLESVDFFKEEVAKIQQGTPSNVEATELLQRIQAYMPVLKSSSGTPGKSEAPEAPKVPEVSEKPEKPKKSEAPEKPEKRSAKKGTRISKPENQESEGSPGTDTGKGHAQDSSKLRHFTATVFFEEGCKMENIRAYQIVVGLQDFADEILTVPADLLEDCSEEIIKNGVTFEIYTSFILDEIKNKIAESLFVKTFQILENSDYTGAEEISDDTENTLSPGLEAFEEKSAPEKQGQPESDIKYSSPAPSDSETPASAIKPEGKKPPSGGLDPITPAVKQSFISVSVEKLDRLLDLVGEIVITESMVTSNPDLKGLKLENFEKAAAMLRKNTDELQDAVMSVRMIPISSTFHKMSRIVRDTSKKIGKEVELTILGEETEVDKNIIDNLSDPLMHIIRNSMDHGLEATKEERLAAGKPGVGSIILEARNSGSDVIITITDDGRGFNREAILKKAVSQGLLTKNETEYSDKEIYQFIMLPGFSTKEQVTELSGRGVGMDVVKKNIEKVGGSVSLDSLPGKGSTVTIKIPLTLAILNGMEITVGKNTYIVPTLNIRESFKTVGNASDIIVDPEYNEMIMLRGECYPIVRLHKLFNIKDALTNFDDGIMIIGEDDGNTIALFADELVGEQQVVLKPIPPFITKRIGHIKGISGCTLLGDGSISLIIDVKDLGN